MYGRRVGSTNSTVGSGVTSAIVGYGVGVNVGVGVGVIVGVLVGRDVRLAVGSSTVSSTSAAGTGAGIVTRTSVTQSKSTTRSAPSISKPAARRLRLLAERTRIRYAITGDLDHQGDLGQNFGNRKGLSSSGEFLFRLYHALFKSQKP